MIDVHARFSALLPAYFADALSEAEHAWIEQHRAECAGCAELFARLEARLPELRDHAGHAPVSVLEDLAQPDSPLTKLERQLVLQHLESCAACMAEARALGYAERARTRIVPTWLWRAGFAAAAALVMFVAIRPEVPTPVHGPTPIVEHAPAPSVARTTVRIALTEPTRGAAAPVTIALVDSSTNTLAIELPPIFLADSSAMTIRVVAASGTTFSQRSLIPDELALPIRLDSTTGPWPPGRYVLELVPAGTGDVSIVRRYEFELRARRP